MGGRYSPRRCPRRQARIPRCSRPSTIKRPRWNLVCGGARPLRPSLPGGSRSPHGLLPGRCARWLACWSTVSSSGRSACPCACMTSRCLATQACPHAQRRQGCCPYVDKWPWSNAREVSKRVRRSRVYSPITCCAATPWASTAHGMRRPQHKKAVGAFRPLEHGL